MEVPVGEVCENDGIVSVPAAPPLLNFLFLFLFRRRPNTLLRKLNLNLDRLFRNLRENLLLDEALSPPSVFRISVKPKGFKAASLFIFSHFLFFGKYRYQIDIKIII